MLDQFKGCLLGAAIGDALGMARESTPPDFQRLHDGYRRAWRGHPNAGLKPGQFTDDTQLMLLVAGMLADGTYSESAYTAALVRMYMNEELRFPDGAVDAACRHLLLTDGGKPGGVSSNTAGCISIAVPFGLAYGEPVDVTVYQTVPLAFFLISRIRDIADLLTTAAHVGGNTDTIALICGAYAGAIYGKAALPRDLLDGLEGRDEIESTAARLYERCTAKP